ncbi:OmpW/AlkL family protein [Acinetobacter larvae]|uniref:OmpW family protein n=1 Tax=Acinetobacter larvae TaxID=1789224 RepID=A0A1B2LWL3_9GAMM|nr:OmpW family outer membrane protein [Acinetobacter larvae]AOA57325.1 hypothetical protein BFG52_02440 [Acinetobacter larvae]
MNNKCIKQLLSVILFSMPSMLCYADDFKKFSISAGWFHIRPQGNSNPMAINTLVNEGRVGKVGQISTSSFLRSIDPAYLDPDGSPYKPFIQSIFVAEPPATMSAARFTGLEDSNGNLRAEATGSAQVGGLEYWRQKDTGLEAKNANTIGMNFNYYLNDKVSLKFVGGIPPKVNVRGKGTIRANMIGWGIIDNRSVAEYIGHNVPIKDTVPITNLARPATVSSARAWTPTLEFQYQFGQRGVNKFRPYLGAGLMYAYFSHIKLHQQTRHDLVAAGHMIQNIMTDKAGAAMDQKSSNAKPVVKVKSEDSIAPIISLGFTYDFNEQWFSVASVSYAKLSTTVQIDVVNANNSQRLIRSSTKLDVDPIISYLGIGYRF